MVNLHVGKLHSSEDELDISTWNNVEKSNKHNTEYNEQDKKGEKTTILLLYTSRNYKLTYVGHQLEMGLWDDLGDVSHDHFLS